MLQTRSWDGRGVERGDRTKQEMLCLPLSVQTSMPAWPLVASCCPPRAAFFPQWSPLSPKRSCQYSSVAQFLQVETSQVLSAKVDGTLNLLNAVRPLRQHALVCRVATGCLGSLPGHYHKRLPCLAATWVELAKITIKRPGGGHQ